MKVNVWKLGYTSFKDYLRWDKSKAECRDMGSVELDKKKDLWEEEVWHLLNWSCWNYDEEGNSIKPDNVNSPLDHCNSDIIINIDGTSEYKFAKSFGWGKARSLGEAIKKMKKEITCEFWPFPEVTRFSGQVKYEGDKVLQKIKGKWTEITW